MRNWAAAAILVLLAFSIQPACAADPASPESTPAVSAEATPPVSIEAAISGEAIKIISPEVMPLASSEAAKPITSEAQAAASPEVSSPAPSITAEASNTASIEAAPPPGIIPPPASPANAAPPQLALEEGASYKGVPWGADFARFKDMKSYKGELISPSAAFINSVDDNDIALLFDAPVSGKGKKGEQRIMFEYVPQKFASVYCEPDDVHYIFYNGRLAMAYSRIAEKNFDVYRDNFYKKYTQTGMVAKKYALAANRSYRLDAIAFKKGKTRAFLARCQLSEKKKTDSTAKVLFVAAEMFDPIREEIKGKIADQKRSKSSKEQELLQKDLQKIE